MVCSHDEPMTHERRRLATRLFALEQSVERQGGSRVAVLLYLIVYFSYIKTFSLTNVSYNVI